MATVTLLIEGAAGDEYWSSVTLITTGSEQILVDPGTVEPRQLLDALAKKGLTPADIDLVALTHPHLDHTRNLALFPDAPVLDYWGRWEGQRLEDNREERAYNEEITILYTPGHCEESITLLVTTPEGRIAICGDVYWDEHGPEHDAYANDHEKLKASRQRIRREAAFIIPGHGPKFSTKSNQ